MLTNEDLKNIGDLFEAKFDRNVPSLVDQKLEPIHQQLTGIGNLIDKKLEPIHQQLAGIGNLIDKKLEPIHQELAGIGDLIDKKLEPIKKDLRKIRADVSQTKRDVNTIIEVFDEEDIKLRHRVEVIEDKVGIRN